MPRVEIRRRRARRGWASKLKWNRVKGTEIITRQKNPCCFVKSQFFVKDLKFGQDGQVDGVRHVEESRKKVLPCL